MNKKDKLSVLPNRKKTNRIGLESGSRRMYVLYQARIQGRWNRWIFTTTPPPFFWASFFLFLSFFLIPQPGIGCIILWQKFTPHFKILDPHLYPCVCAMPERYFIISFQRDKHERKHKKNENIWSYCLCLYLRLCQGRSYSTLLQSCGICYPHELKIPNKLGRKSADEDLICCQGNFIALF